MQCQITIDCELPIVPNHLKTPNGQVPVSAVTEEALRELGKAWVEALVMRARQQRESSECGEGVTKYLQSIGRG